MRHIDLIISSKHKEGACLLGLFSNPSMQKKRSEENPKKRYLSYFTVSLETEKSAQNLIKTHKISQIKGMSVNFLVQHIECYFEKQNLIIKMQATCSKLTRHCWNSPVDLPNETPPHISQWAGWSVCSIKSRYPPQLPVHSYMGPLSRSSHDEKSGTSVPPAGSDKTADHGGSRTTEIEPAAPEVWMAWPSLLLWCTSPGSPTSLQYLVPMETTGNRQCGTETQQRHLAHSSLCWPVSSSPLFLFSLLIYKMMNRHHTASKLNF